MTASNMPVLWQNNLLQYRTEIARKAWVWFAETRGTGMQYDADAYANEVERLVLALRPMIDAANRAYNAKDEVLSDLLWYILIRHANWRLGSNTVPGFLKRPCP